MTQGDSADAFDLSEEANELREAYGKGTFGQGCLLARRLVERGVPFVEVSLNSSTDGNYGWDTTTTTSKKLNRYPQNSTQVGRR